MLILHVDISIIILSCSYLVQSGDTVLIPDLKFETKSGRKYLENVYKGDIFQDPFKLI